MISRQTLYNRQQSLGRLRAKIPAAVLVDVRLADVEGFCVYRCETGLALLVGRFQVVAAFLDGIAYATAELSRAEPSRAPDGSA